MKSGWRGDPQEWRIPLDRRWWRRRWLMMRCGMLTTNQFSPSEEIQNIWLFSSSSTLTIATSFSKVEYINPLHRHGYITGRRAKCTYDTKTRVNALERPLILSINGVWMVLMGNHHPFKFSIPTNVYSHRESSSSRGHDATSKEEHWHCWIIYRGEREECNFLKHMHGSSWKLTVLGVC